MRSALAALAGLVAVVLLPLSLAAIWADHVVGDTDSYVAAVAPLAQDTGVQDVVARAVARELLDASGTPAGSAPAGIVRRVVATAVRSPAFTPVWTSANRTAHEQVLRVLDGTTRPDRAGRLRLDLGTLRLPGVRVVVRSPVVTLPLATQDQLVRARQGYQALQTAHTLLPVACVVAALLALALARRRRATLARLAVGAALTLLVLVGALLLVRGYVGRDLPSVDQPLAVAVWDALSHPLRLQALWGAAGAAVLAVVAGAAARIGR